MTENLRKIAKFNLWDGKRFPEGLQRTLYTKKIVDFIGNQLIKVLVGQRRSGKSYILRQLAMYLIDVQKVTPNNILYINKEFLSFDAIDNYQDLENLYQEFLQNLQPKGKVYLFIDEVQNITGWEKFVNAHSQDFTTQCEIFITGSNSNLLSGELATLLSGRYVEFKIFPYNYNEQIQLLQQPKNRTTYLNFLNFGGLPELYNLPTTETQKQYTTAVKDTVLLRDIAHRYTIRDLKLLDDIFSYLVNNASNLLSINNLTNYFKAKKRKTSYETVANYIGYIEEAFLIHKCERYNIKGKDVVGGSNKYYVNDLAFKNLLYVGFGFGLGYLLENMVYLDLKRAGYTVYTGNWDTKEVDFVAIKDDNICYIQCAYILEEPQTIEREYSVLERIKDNYSKYVVSLNEQTLPQRNGIHHIQAWNLSEYI